MTQTVLRTVRCGAEQPMLIARPHLRGCPGWARRIATTLVQSPDHGKIGAARRGHGKGDPGIWYGAQVCILAHEGGLWVTGNTCCYSAFRLHSEHIQGQGAGSYPMLSQESGRVEPDGRLRQFPAPVAWQGVARAVVAQ